MLLRSRVGQGRRSPVGDGERSRRDGITVRRRSSQIVVGIVYGDCNLVASHDNAVSARHGICRLKNASVFSLNQAFKRSGRRILNRSVVYEDVRAPHSHAHILFRYRIGRGGVRERIVAVRPSYGYNIIVSRVRLYAGDGHAEKRVVYSIPAEARRREAVRGRLSGSVVCEARIAPRNSESICGNRVRAVCIRYRIVAVVGSRGNGIGSRVRVSVVAIGEGHRIAVIRPGISRDCGSLSLALVCQRRVAPGDRQRGGRNGVDPSRVRERIVAVRPSYGCGVGILSGIRSVSRDGHSQKCVRYRVFSERGYRKAVGYHLTGAVICEALASPAHRELVRRYLIIVCRFSGEAVVGVVYRNRDCVASRILPRGISAAHCAYCI